MRQLCVNSHIKIMANELNLSKNQTSSVATTPVAPAVEVVAHLKLLR